MSSRLPHLALLALSAAVAAAAGGACFTPIPQAALPDTGDRRTDAGDAGPSNLDGSCPECLPACEGTCTPDVGCPFATGGGFTLGCAPANYSLAVASSDAGTLELTVSTCACGEAWVGTGAPGAWNGNETFHSSCGRTLSRVGPADERMILVNEPTGTVRLFERRWNGSWRLTEPPQIRAPAALEIDSAGNPHLAGLGQGAVLHLVRINEEWIIDPAANADSDTRGLVILALGPDDLPRIAFSEGDVKLATKSGSADAGFQWQHSTASFRGTPLSLEVDAQGRANLLYLDHGVRYALQTANGAWVAELVDEKATAAQLAFTSDGCPWAIWSRDGIYFGERTAAGWTSDRVAEGTFGAEDEPLVILPDRRPMVLHGGATMSFSGR
ncbi:MAG: hypothetical protein QM765_32060 [Myxococcales bacterium]